MLLLLDALLLSTTDEDTDGDTVLDDVRVVVTDVFTAFGEVDEVIDDGVACMRRSADTLPTRLIVISMILLNRASIVLTESTSLLCRNSATVIDAVVGAAGLDNSRLTRNGSILGSVVDNTIVGAAVSKD